MEYGIVEKGIFCKRLNRFSAIVQVCGKEEVCHVKNTGRLGELLIPGAEVYLKFSDSELRKTHFDLISVENQGQIINIDSQAPNKVFGEWVKAGKFRTDVQLIRPEFTFGDSRFDFKLECTTNTQFVEVKGVTLLRDGCAYFPDAPTERGVKHIRGLMRAIEEGYEAAIVFVIQMKGCNALAPNDLTQSEFGKVLREAAAVGVGIYAYDCYVTENILTIDAPIQVHL